MASLIDQLQKETDINELKRTTLSHHQRDLGTRRTIRKVIRGGTVYILQEFVFHVHCFCCPLHVFFCLFVFGGGHSTVTIISIMNLLEQASNEPFFLSFTQLFCFIKDH